MLVLDEINIQERSINQKSNNTMPVMLCTGASFLKKNSCLVATIVSFDTAGPNLLTYCILEPYPSKDIELDLSSIISHSLRYYSPSNSVPFESMLPTFQLQGNIAIT